jgi:hypothetical protein
MPTIRDLHRLRASPRYRIPIPGASVTRDDSDSMMAGQPRLDRCRLAIRQKVNNAATLEVADNGAVALPPLPREVVNTNNDKRRYRGNRRVPPDQSEQTVAARRQSKPMREAAACGTS